MSYSLASASSQGLRWTFGSTIGPPFTIACWIKPTTLAGCALAWSATAQSGYSLNITAAGNINATHQNGASSTTATSAIADNISTGAWVHIAGVFTSSTSRQSFCNGNPGTLNTSSLTAISSNEFDIGFKYNSSSAKINFYNGLIAGCSMWQKAMPAAFIKAQALGGFPYRAASTQQWHFTLYDPAAKITSWGNVSNGGNDLTLVGSPTFTALYPPIGFTRNINRMAS